MGPREANFHRQRQISARMYECSAETALKNGAFEADPAPMPVGEDMAGPERLRRQVPLPAVAALVALLVAAPVGLALSPGKADERAKDDSLADVARTAGCRLSEFTSDPHSNPPVSGRVDEWVNFRDGSYVGRRPPSREAAIHAMFHGRVLIQYRPDLPAPEIARLDREVRSRRGHVLLFENRTGMAAHVAATAYLTLMSCPAVSARTLPALRAFSERRADWGQAF
jgi:hypothetical protein